MREIQALEITNAVAELSMKTNYYISPDIKEAFIEAKEKETDFLSKDVLNKLIENSEIAATDDVPICQDTGMTVVFLEIGQDVHVVGGNVEDAVNEGVKKGYTEGYLRKSVVKDPFDRVNTKDNTPAVIHYKIVPGDKIKITVSPKGFGSENMSALKMLKPSQGVEGVIDFVLQTVKDAGPNPCPPLLLGIGVGGTMEKAAQIAKEALLRPIGDRNKDEFVAKLEMELLEKVNALDIGPGGFGGITTALNVAVNTYATHIAGLPVAVNIGCHATRHYDITL